jgi:hypothetical protein
VRLHHFFERFPRSVACGLLACRHSWFKPYGVLHIEAPDFSRTARIILSPFSSFNQCAVAERHLFGSHEAPWAVHYEGYSLDLLKKMLASFGFAVCKVARRTWCGTYNIEVIAKRHAETLNRNQFISSADTFLRNFLFNPEELELRIHKTWMELFAGQLEQGWAR